MKIQTTKAKKHFGQNFLVNHLILDKIIEFADIHENDFILEIGPGTGNLTRLLNKKSQNYLGLEIDESLKHYLLDFNIKFTDSLDFDIRTLPNNYKLIANIPYYITSPILNHYLMQTYINSWPSPQFMILMVQKEFAEKICRPDKSSLLQTSINCIADSEYLLTVPAADFDPIPKVDSAIIKLTPNPKVPEDINFKKFWGFLKVLYSKPRKKVKNTLKAVCKDLNIFPEILYQKRAEELNLNECLELYSVYRGL